MAISPISYQNYQSNNINFKGTNLVNVARKQEKNLKVVFLGLAGLLGYKVIKDNNKDFQVTKIGAGKEGVLIDYIDSNGKFNCEFFRQTEKEKMMDFLSEKYGVELEKSSTASNSNNQAISIKEDDNGVSFYVGQRGEFIPTSYLTRKEPLQKQQSPMLPSLREQYIPNIRYRAETTGQQVKTELSQGVKDLISQGIMTQKEAEMFNEIYNLEGEEFATKAYDLIAKSMNLKEYPNFRFAPLSEGTRAHCGGEGITLNSTLNWTKEDLLGFIRHELEHFKQNVEIVKEFGINKFIEAHMSAIMHQYAETPGYCYSQFDKSWEDMPELEKYIAIVMEMDKRFPDGIHNNTLALLQRASGDTETIEDWHVKYDLAAELRLCRLELNMSNSKLSLDRGNFFGFDSKAEQYLYENYCYLSPGNLLNSSDIRLLEGGRYTREELLEKVQIIFDTYNNCSIEREAYKEENTIQQKWEAFVKAKKN